MTHSAHPFAPGAIERHPAKSQATARRWAKRAAWCTSFALIAGLLAGYFTGA